MESQLFELAAANGIWAVLFVGLFLYQLKDSRAREKKYQETIESLVQSVAVVADIKEDLERLSVDVNAITIKPKHKNSKEIIA